MEELMDTDANIGPPEATEQNKTEEHAEAGNNIAVAAAASSGLEYDSDSGSDDEEQDRIQLQTLELELVSNPSKYGTHVQYIKLLRKTGELEKLRQARESMSCLFPLSPSLWREWAKDETSLISGPESVQQVEQLYERAVFDYLSIPLWCDYLGFILEHDLAVRELLPAGISKARNLFERALMAAGLHFSEGNRIWEAFKEFEQMVLNKIEESDSEEKEKQVQRVRKIFQRQLSVPLCDMNSTLLAYKAWEDDHGNGYDFSHVDSAYQKVSDMCNACADFEAQISKPDIADVEKVSAFMIYLKFEETSGTPARVQILYERAITDFPVSADLWLNYTSYLDKTIKVGKTVKDVYARATKSCPWVGELWVKYLLCLERSWASEEEVSTVFEKAIQCTYSSYDEYLNLFLTRVDGLRRRISVADQSHIPDFSILRGTFQTASDYLQTALKGTEAYLHLHAYWARLEISLGKDIAAARGVWESLLKISGTMLEAWKCYIAMEVEQGNIQAARAIYRRCYAKRFLGSGSEDICHSWLRFEREFGTLEDYDRAVQKVSPRLQELQQFKEQEARNAPAAAGETESSVKKTPHKKRKATSDLPEDQSPAKRQKDAAQRVKKGSNKSSGAVDQNVDEGSKMDLGGAKAEKESCTDVQQTKKYTNQKPVYTDQCTVFISNLSPKANEEHLRKFFSDVGGVHSIRILKDKFSGVSRGLAYVDFADDEHLSAAIAKNRQTLMGKKLSIARSNPKQSKKRGPGGHSQAADDGRKTTSGPARTQEERPVAVKGSGATHEVDKVVLKGKNTFAVPRNVKALGWSTSKPKVQEVDEPPKSNDEFRNMLLKK